MSITGHTQVYFIIGDPVSQVRAPEVYNALFARHGIDAVLVPMRVAAVDLQGWVRHALKAQNVGGLWATIPHKPALVGLVDRIDPLARVAGAVNAVRRCADGSTDGALFDGIGFVKGLDQAGITITGQRALMLGAGGGGQAVAAALLSRGIGELAIHNRSRARAEALVTQLRAEARSTGSASVIRVADDTDPAGYGLVVNCTSQGLKPDDPMPTDPARIDAGAAVVDIIMSREPTPLLRACAERGIAAHAGFEMLVQQVPEYLRFFGHEALAQTLQHDLAEVRALLRPR